LQIANLAAQGSFEQVGSSFCRLKPGVDELDAGAVKVGHVAGCQRSAARAADGGDKRVEARDRFPSALAAAGDDRIVLRSSGIDRDDLVGEGREGLIGCG